MSLESVFDNILLLQFTKIAVFIGLFIFTTDYVLPKGIAYFLEWKKEKSHKQLRNSVFFLSASGASLIYLISRLLEK